MDGATWDARGQNYPKPRRRCGRMRVGVHASRKVRLNEIESVRAREGAGMFVGLKLCYMSCACTRLHSYNFNDILQNQDAAATAIQRNLRGSHGRKQVHQLSALTILRIDHAPILLMQPQASLRRKKQKEMINKMQSTWIVSDLFSDVTESNTMRQVGRLEGTNWIVSNVFAGKWCE